MKQTVKDRAVLFLNRRIKALEEESNVDQVKMAESGLSYADRRALAERRERYAQENKVELETMREVLEYVRQAPEDKF